MKGSQLCATRRGSCTWAARFPFIALAVKSGLTSSRDAGILL